MSEDTVINPVADLDTKKAKAKAELAAAKQHADSIGAKYHHRAGIEKVKEAIAKREKELQAEAEPEAATERLEESQDSEMTMPEGATARMLTQAQYEAEHAGDAKKEANRLIRCRIQCMNPAKREWPGEIISVGSSKLGTFKKYIPYNGEPYHVPKIIFDFLKERQCRVGVKTRDRYGNDTTEGKLIQEYAIEELPPLTRQELQDLARRQAMASGTTE